MQILLVLPGWGTVTKEAAFANYTLKPGGVCVIRRESGVATPNRFSTFMGTLRIGEFKIDSIEEQYLFETEVYLGAFDAMVPAEEPGGTDGRFVFIALVPAVRPFADLTAQLLACHPGASAPLEAPHILWQQ